MDEYIDELVDGVDDQVPVVPPTPEPPRMVPGWHLKGQLGVFIHWGVYSVPGYNAPTKHPRKLANGSEWYLKRLKNTFLYGEATRKYHEEKYPGLTYRDLAPLFDASLFDADAWVNTFAAAGATYIVITAKHHDGFCLWPVSPALRGEADADWNAMSVGPRRDLIGELEAAARRRGLAFGIYYSLLEWDNSRYASDKARDRRGGELVGNYARREVQPQLRELVIRYNPDLLWLDGDWGMLPSYWGADEFRAWLHDYAPACVTNDRWGIGCHGAYGDVHAHSDRFDPAVAPPHKWESCMTIGDSWGFDRTMARRKSNQELMRWALRTVRRGGNALLNVGPTAMGEIPAADIEALVAVGTVLRRARLI